MKTEIVVLNETTVYIHKGTQSGNQYTKSRRQISNFTKKQTDETLVNIFKTKEN